MWICSAFCKRDHHRCTAPGTPRPTSAPVWSRSWGLRGLQRSLESSHPSGELWEREHLHHTQHRVWLVFRKAVRRGLQKNFLAETQGAELFIGVCMWLNWMCFFLNSKSCLPVEFVQFLCLCLNFPTPLVAGGKECGWLLIVFHARNFLTFGVASPLKDHMVILCWWIRVFVSWRTQRSVNSQSKGRLYECNHTPTI